MNAIRCLYITENGMSCHDCVSPDGCVHDPNRIDFLDSYLGKLQKAADDGADIRGYFLWSFLDNFEWSRGYSERFGIVYVDFQTLARTVKDSAFWYKKIMETNGKSLNANKTHSEMLFIKNSDKKGVILYTSGQPDYIVAEGLNKGKQLSELCKTEPELFGNRENAFKAASEMVNIKDGLKTETNGTCKKNDICKLSAYDRYSVYHCEIDGNIELGKSGGLVICNVISGDGIANGRLIKARDTFILPSGLPAA